MSNYKAVRRLVQEMRRNLAEDADVSVDMHTAGKNWLAFIKGGDHFLEAVQGVVDACDKLAAEKLPERKKHHMVDVRSNVKKVSNIAGPMYSQFATGRDAMYACAKAWGVSTTTKGGKRGGNIAGESADDLLSGMDSRARKLMSAGSGALDAGAKAGRGFLDAYKAAKTTPLTDDQKAKLIDNGRIFRDLVSEAMFARTTGIMNRAVRFLDMAWSASLDESMDAAWASPWAHDPEIGTDAP